MKPKPPKPTASPLNSAPPVVVTPPPRARIASQNNDLAPLKLEDDSDETAPPIIAEAPDYIARTNAGPVPTLASSNAEYIQAPTINVPVEKSGSSNNQEDDFALLPPSKSREEVLAEIVQRDLQEKENTPEALDRFEDELRRRQGRLPRVKFQFTLQNLMIAMSGLALCITMAQWMIGTHWIIILGFVVLCGICWVLGKREINETVWFADNYLVLVIVLFIVLSVLGMWL